MYVVELLERDRPFALLDAPRHLELSARRRCRIPLRQLPADPSAIEHRLLAGFAAIEEVLVTGSSEGLIVVCRGREDVDAWIDCAGELFDMRREDDRARWPRRSRRRRDDTGSA
jgi:hypothetical protein